MTGFADGFLLMRIADELADLGAAVVLSEENVDRVREIVEDPECHELVALRLNDSQAATLFLDRILERSEQRGGLSDDDEQRLVSSAAALGSLLLHAAADPAAEAFETSVAG